MRHAGAVGDGHQRCWSDSACDRFLREGKRRGGALRNRDICLWTARLEEPCATDRKKLFTEFEEIRKKGIAWDREESIRGGVCFSAPIWLDGDRVVAVISLSTPTIRMDKKHEAEVQAALLESAAAIAKQL